MPPRSSDDCGTMGGLCEYPPQLNASAALGFDRSGEFTDLIGIPPAVRAPTAPLPLLGRPAPAPGLLREADGNARREDEEMTSQLQDEGMHEVRRIDPAGGNSSSSSSVLSDDLILCRLSSLLPPPSLPPPPVESESNRRRRPILVRKVSTSDVDSSSDDDDTTAETEGTRRRSQRRPRPTFSLIPGDAAVVLPTILHHPDECQTGPRNGSSSSSDDGSSSASSSSSSSSSPVRSLLLAVGIDEVESLDPTNGGPAAGQCQFACVASALTSSALKLRDGYRPDLELRQLALHAIRMNPELYRNFLTVAGGSGRTRKNSLAGGEGVDLDGYLRTMSNPACDGDAVTLQALCDALKIAVRIVKPVGADAYDEERQNERLYGSSASSASSDDELDNEDDASSTTSTSSISSSGSALSWSDNPYSSCCCGIDHGHGHGHGHHHHHSSSSHHSSNGALRRERLYVSQEIRPRRLPRIDTRIRDVQRVARGRLVWLSHIGDEAHYRFLRPLSLSPMSSSCQATTGQQRQECCARPHGPVNPSEAALARRSRLLRHRRLDALCSRQDGFVRPYFHREEAPNCSGGGRSSSSAGRQQRPSSLGELAVVSDDKLRRLGRTAKPSLSPRCGLCFAGLLSSSSSSVDAAAATTVSPSGCHHDFCRSCIVSWSASVSNNCPACGCHFMELVDSKERVVKVAAGTATTTAARSVTPPTVGGCAGVCGTDGNAGTADDGERRQVSLLCRERLPPDQTVHSPPPPLPATFDLDEAIEVQTNGEALAVSALNRQFLIELGKDGALRRTGGSNDATYGVEGASERVLLRLLSKLSSMANGAHLRDLLEANVLSVIRLLLTPIASSSAGRSSAVRSTPVSPAGLHVPRGEMFLMCLLILEGINQRCCSSSGPKGGAGGKGRGSLLTTAMLHKSLDLPKLLLWYVSCPALRGMARYQDGLECARRVLSGWSRRHCLSIVEALQRNGSTVTTKRTTSTTTDSSQVRKRPANPSGGPTKKRKVATSPRSTGTSTSPAKKRGRPLGSTKKRSKPPSPARPPTRPKPIVRIRRAAGKRQIRPVECVNISRDEWSERVYRR